MGLWDLVTAHKIKVHKSCKREIQRFLKRLSPGDLFKPATWKHMPAFVRVVPDDDVLPSRGKYTLESNDWQVALNHLSATSQKTKDALWYSLPDVVASVLLTERIPTIVDAFRIAIPSSNIASCACVSDTVPLVACGQINLPRSSLFANKHNPSPLHQRTFSKSPRLPRNTNT
jgi:hypothetical protein